MTAPGLRKPDGRFTWQNYLAWPDEERWEIIDGAARRRRYTALTLASMRPGLLPRKHALAQAETKTPEPGFNEAGAACHGEPFWIGFNPRPALRPGDALLDAARLAQVVVSIRARH